MDILRTPDGAFSHLPGYPFAPRYLDAGGIRIHYVDEGDPQASPVLLLHGEPSWSYLYRKMIPIITKAGLRAVAPDLVGFGRSDKLASRAGYTYQAHVDWMRAVLTGLDLRGATLVGQDWGGLIGLRLVAEHPDRFDRVVAANTFLPTGDQPLGEGFHRWKNFSQSVEVFDVGFIIQSGCVTALPDDIRAAYTAPFPDEKYKEGARQFPMLVPASPDDPAAPANRKAWEVLMKWEKPFLTAFSDSDPVTKGADLMLQALIPGAKGQPHVTITGAGHFLQEDKGEDLARAIVDFIARTPLKGGKP